MAKKLGVGLIGTGFGVSAHAPVFQAHPDFELVAICSGRLERARDAAHKFGAAHAFNDYNEMLKLDEVQVVSITTPPYLHREMALAAARAGKHVICEKPMALNAAEAREMLDAATNSGIAHAIVFEFRYQSERAHIRNLLRQGYVGKVQSVSLKAFGKLAWATQNAQWIDWMADPERGGGYLGSWGSHYIDCLRNWLGDFASVYGEVDYYTPSIRLPDGSEVTLQADDGFRALFDLTSGARGAMCFNLAVSTPEVPKERLSPNAVAGAQIEIYGDEGTLILGLEGPPIGARGGKPVGPLEVPALAPLPFPTDGMSFLQVALGRLFDDFARACRGEPAPEMATFLDGLRCQEFIDGVRASDLAKRKVALLESDGDPSSGIRR